MSKRRVLVSIAIGGLASSGLLGGTAGADPVNQPLGSNCHGYQVAQFASAEPEGVGNTVGGRGVQVFQRAVRSSCQPGL